MGRSAVAGRPIFVGRGRDGATQALFTETRCFVKNIVFRPEQGVWAQAAYMRRFAGSTEQFATHTKQFTGPVRGFAGPMCGFAGPMCGIAEPMDGFARRCNGLAGAKEQGAGRERSGRDAALRPARPGNGFRPPPTAGWPGTASAFRPWKDFRSRSAKFCPG